MKTINLPCQIGGLSENKRSKKVTKNYSHKNDKNALVTEKSDVFYEYLPKGGIYYRKRETTG